MPDERPEVRKESSNWRSGLTGLETRRGSWPGAGHSMILIFFCYPMESTVTEFDCPYVFCDFQSNGGTPLDESVNRLQYHPIEPPRGWFNLPLKELWDYRELLYFYVWRDVKVRYKQPIIGVLWVVLQPTNDHGCLHSFLRSSRKALLPMASLTLFSIFPRSFPGPISPTRSRTAPTWS